MCSLIEMRIGIAMLTERPDADAKPSIPADVVPSVVSDAG